MSTEPTRLVLINIAAITNDARPIGKQIWSVPHYAATETAIAQLRRWNSQEPTGLACYVARVIDRDNEHNILTGIPKTIVLGATTVSKS